MKLPCRVWVKQFVIFGYSGTGTSLFVLPPVNICSLLNAKALLLPVSEKQFVVGAHFPLTSVKSDFLLQHTTRHEAF
jgi:hypothetical protein